jgi:hypothetical protein
MRNPRRADAGAPVGSAADPDGHYHRPFTLADEQVADPPQ